ncbi:NAD-dependent epimerase/dehydratase family protein [Tahibacter amnicola]|uniref:NAD-dependent epimerase/dehydratase family protein n=1 Tax=Tahibacter amnicola TaxID=2976241 RepID=A0ABY6BGY4_9GAMM|nr:NAD-dependent epimerase/dehydratase family protein [Tahibacter amnicola]UXI67122.1 NAD-dependent epimerase/dehydratase family protein [Tahibacter amnicola]
MKILVTGASGFVGGALMHRFGGRDDVRVHGVARRGAACANYTTADLSRPFDVPFDPDVVIHAAARSSPWGRRGEFHQQNVEATRQVIAFCRRRSVRKLVYISSSSVFYRNVDQVGITESSPIGPDFVNEYAATKYAGEELVRGFEGQWAILRPRAVFGPGDTVVFPRILAAARQGRLPIIARRDEAPVLGDLIYIDTLSDYIFAAATREDVTGTFNLTNDEPVAILPFLLDVLDRLGLPRPRRRVSVGAAMVAARLSEITCRLLPFLGEPPVTRFGVGVFAYSKTFNVAKMREVLGAPSVSLSDGVERFVHWQRQSWA